MSMLLGLVPPAIWAALSGIVLASLGFLGYKLHAAGVDSQKAKEAKARDQNLADVKRADAAVPGDILRDPNNRDNRV